MRVAQRIPEVFQELRKHANPKFMLTGTGHQVVANITPQSATTAVPRMDVPNPAVVLPAPGPASEPLRPTPVTGPNGAVPQLPETSLPALPKLTPPPVLQK